MSFEQVIASLALIAGLLSKNHRREAALAFGYAALVVAFSLIAPTPETFAHVGYAWWFLYCAVGEGLIMMMAWAVDAPATPYIAILSTINLIQHLFLGFEYRFLHSAALYGIYQHLVPTIEILQVITLFAFSGPSIFLMRWLLHHYYPERKPPWMLRIFHYG
jgi:hypothetical protein